MTEYKEVMNVPLLPYRHQRREVYPPQVLFINCRRCQKVHNLLKQCWKDKLIQSLEEEA